MFRCATTELDLSDPVDPPALAPSCPMTEHGGPRTRLPPTMIIDVCHLSLSGRHRIALLLQLLILIESSKNFTLT